MPTDQNNSRYSVPVSRGGEPYDQYINSNFDSLATDVPEAGPIADRPAADNEFAPDRYYATDENIEYYNTGSSWRRLRSVAVAPPGELQSTIDAQANDGPGGYVRLEPGEQYDVGQEIHVKPEITLDCRGAMIHISSDHNGLFVDNEAHVYGLRLRQTSSTFTSAGVVLDTTRSRGNSYNRTGNTYETVVTGAMVNMNDRTGTGLELNASSGPISIPNYFRLSLYTFGIGIDVQVQSDSFVNGAKFDSMVLHGNQTQVRHTQGADGTGGPLITDIYAVSQNSQYVDHIVDNQTSSTSATLIGDMWDVSNMDTSAGASAAKGPLVAFKTRDFHAREIGSNSPDATAGSIAYGWGNGNQTMYDLQSGTQWQWTHDSGERVLGRAGTSIFKYNSDTSEPEVVGDGSGLVVTTPDGTARYRIAVDNTGALTTTQI